MSDEIFLVGNSWSIPCDEAPIPAFNLLGLKTDGKFLELL